MASPYHKPFSGARVNLSGFPANTSSEDSTLINTFLSKVSNKKAGNGECK